MLFSLHGVHLPHRKNTADKDVAHIPVPKTVTIPMSMHIGRPANPCVKVGDRVSVGTLIGQAAEGISSPVYSSVSGTVKKIDDILLSNGSSAKAVVIESDGENTVCESVTPPVINSAEEFVDALKSSGIVGLGGAGFPTYVKFDVRGREVEELIVNGAECEPYITSDSYVMTKFAEDISLAVSTVKKYIPIKRVIIGIEKNKPQAIKAMKQLADSCSYISVKELPSLYPQGGEKVLVYHTTGKVIPEGKLPLDVKCIVSNVSTLAEIGKFIRTGMPLVDRTLTVDGGCVANPQNVVAPIGTALSDVFEFCGGFTEEPEKVLYGGPMMGISVPDLDAPILKNTNAVLALTKKEATLPKTTNCIRCGACQNHCPFGINPAAIAKAYKNKDIDRFEELGANLCMECGCCSYVCPANRPLVQTNKMAKALIREAELKKGEN